MKKSQTEKVLTWMKISGGITTLDAMHLGVLRLSARIADLRKAGYQIESEPKTIKTASGDKARIVVYRLRGEQL